MVSCAALSAVIPKPKYFFVNGLWRPETQLTVERFNWKAYQAIKPFIITTTFTRQAVTTKIGDKIVSVEPNLGGQLPFFQLK